MSDYWMKVLRETELQPKRPSVKDTWSSIEMKTSELEGAALDWAVAKCEGFTNLRKNTHRFNSKWIMTPPRVEFGPVYLEDYAYSTDWAHGGPIIEREMIRVAPNVSGKWTATIKELKDDGTLSGYYKHHHGVGETSLIAAMRCNVASKLGDEVEIPEELK